MFLRQVNNLDYLIDFYTLIILYYIQDIYKPQNADNLIFIYSAPPFLSCGENGCQKWFVYKITLPRVTQI